MALELKYFRVNINNVTGPGDKAGFIDHVTLQEYINNGAGTYPSNLNNAENKARGNLRYIRMINLLQENISTVSVIKISNGGATVDTEGANFEFTLVYDRGPIYTYNELFGTAHPSGTLQILENEDAIKRMISRVFIDDFVSNMWFPYDPSPSNLGYNWIDKDVKAAAVFTGSLESRITASEALISVTQIPNT